MVTRSNPPFVPLLWTTRWTAIAKCAPLVTGARRRRALDCTQISNRYARAKLVSEACGAGKARLEKSGQAPPDERRERTTLRNFTSTAGARSTWFAVCPWLLRALSDGGCAGFTWAAVEAAPSPQWIDQLRQLPQVRWAGGTEVSGLPFRNRHAT